MLGDTTVSSLPCGVSNYDDKMFCMNEPTESSVEIIHRIGQGHLASVLQ